MPKTLNRNPQKRSSAQPRSTKRASGASTRRRTAPRAASGKKKVTPALLREMTRRLVNEFDPEQVILFGSRAWGKPTSNSDVDLMVIVTTSKEKDYQRILRAYNALGDLIVPTDIFVKTRDEFDFFAEVPASLENAIARKGKILYARSKTPARAKLVHQGAA